MHLEPLEPTDIQNIDALRPEGWSDLGPIHKNYLDLPFCSPMKVVVEGRIAGLGTAISFGATGWLGHIIVGPEFRNRGIGRFVTEELVALLTGRGCTTVSLVATDLGFPVYKKAGFREEAEYLFLERQEPLQPSPPSENIVQPATNDMVEGILSLDRTASGEDRQVLLTKRLNGCLVYRESGKVTGYYLPESGDGMIIAENPEAGAALVKVKHTATTKATLPIENKAGIAFLKDNGFAEVRKAWRLIRGEGFPWHPEMLFNRIGGNLG